MTEEYIKTNDIEHILLRPDTYVGSKTFKDSLEYLMNSEGKLTQTIIPLSPALERIFVEILSNAIDNALRYPGTTKNIKINVSTNGACDIWNDGHVIPIAKTSVKDENMEIYNHSLIFGFLRTSSNYDDDTQRYVSGRNGFGAKLTNVFSTRFQVEGTDPVVKKKLTQIWTKNMTQTTPPIITSSQKKGYTHVSWKVDFSQFECDQYSHEFIQLFRFHALNAALTTGVNVFFNEMKMPTTLQKYANILSDVPLTLSNYIKQEHSTKTFNTEIIFFRGKGEQISFVNGIKTRNGGKHVDAWCEAICRPIMKKVDASFKDIKKSLKMIIIASVSNPTFESQEKNTLESPSITIPHISDSLVTKILTKWQLKADLKKKLDMKEFLNVVKVATSKKKLNIKGYDKANFAGSKKGKDCILIVCEGLSAKTFAVEGISHGMCHKKGRDWFGIYPLRGKILNTRKATFSTIANNEIITNLINIIGLDLGKPDNLTNTNYGKICIITDADTDGIHIKALILNWIDSCFPKFMKNVICMNTPILRVGKTYYYDERTEITTKGPTKYFKGLGTTERKDIGIIFGKKMTEYIVTDKSTLYLDMAFNNSSSAERKVWVQRYQPGLKRRDTIDYNKDEWNHQTIEDFIEYDLVQYAFDDCYRSIPSVFDGLKESQRKILYAAKKEKFVNDLKITQFAGYVSKDTEYHHGEQNLFSTIIKMAQDYVGSNNVPFFASEAMFGTRLVGGKDASQPRYLHTRLLPTTNLLFPTKDDHLLQTHDNIEPSYFVPILPTILLNGCKGIGTGWCCDIPCFSVDDVVHNVYRLLEGKAYHPMTPSYNKFKGSIEYISHNKFEVQGIWEQISDNEIHVTELPIGYWTEKFVDWCNSHPSILKVKNQSTTEEIDIILTTQQDLNIEKELTVILNINPVVFNHKTCLQYMGIEDIFFTWFLERKILYKKRKEHELHTLQENINGLMEKDKFIQLIRNSTIDLFEKESVITQKLHQHDIFNDSVRNMPTRNLTEEMRSKLQREINKLQNEYHNLKETHYTQIWQDEIKEFLKNI